MSKLKLSEKIAGVSPSKTLAITSLAKAMKAGGKDVIGFAAGEPDFDTPAVIKEAAKAAIDAGFTKYTPGSGTDELKKAIADKFFKDNGLHYSTKQVVVSCGAKHSLYNVLQAICNPGDEVIIISPYWLSYPEIAVLAGAVPRVVATDEASGFKPSIGDIKKAVTPKTKAIIINSPSNPTGIVYSRSELEEISDIVVSKGIYAVSDEIYEKLIYDGKSHVSIASLGKDIYENTITVNGVSKAYSMTGWRIGYIGAPAPVASAVSALQSHSTSNPASISQKAALAALRMDESEIVKMRDEFAARRDLMAGLLKGNAKVVPFRPEGAFYMFCDVSDSGMPAETFAKRLLEEKHVAVIPAESFGSERHIRLSFALGREKIKEGINRINTWVGQ